MPNYFPENDTALPTDSSERSMAKVVSQLPAALDVIGLEPETAVYVARSGATDVAAIDAFVKGVKELGLWDSMVCWPLRSSQNSGGVNPNSNIVYSLGGLGTFNGTRVNGPTWGVNGVNFNATTAHISASATIAQPLTVMGAVNFKATTNGGPLLDGSSRVHLWSGGVSAQTQLFAGTTLSSGASNTFAAGNNFVAGHANGSNSVIYNNGNATSGNAGSNSLGSPTIVIGNNNILSFGNRNIDIAFCAIFSGQAYNDAVRSLYKTTLGTGLGLP